MAAPFFNPIHAVRFDLPHGAVRSGDGDDRVLLVPVAALMDLALASPSEAVEALGVALGAAVGGRAAARLGDPAAASLEDFVTQLAGEVALAGIGVLSVERWGRALVVVLEDSPLLGSLVAPFVTAALESASKRRIWGTLLARDQHAARVFVSNERAIDRVRSWIASGVAWGDAISRLHGGSS
jgi:hypothetical protein